MQPLDGMNVRDDTLARWQFMVANTDMAQFKAQLLQQLRSIG